MNKRSPSLRAPGPTGKARDRATRRAPSRTASPRGRLATHPRPKRIPKPWGHELWWARARKYVAKLLVIEKGRRLSLQYHRRKHETVYSLQGRWRLVLGRRSRVMRPGSVTVIPPGTVHRFEAPFGRVTLVEASTPEVTDIVRLEDDYRRAPPAGGRGNT